MHTNDWIALALIIVTVIDVIVYRYWRRRQIALEKRVDSISRYLLPKRQHTDPEDMLGDIPTYGRPVHGIRGTASCSKCGRRHDVESRCL